MSTNQPGPVNIGHYDAAIFRSAILDSDCTIVGGTDGGVVTSGLVTMTATPDLKEGRVIEPETADGSIAYTVEQRDQIKRYNVSGEFIFFDFELMVMLFGGTLLLGKAGGDFDGQVIGWAAPRADQAASHYGAYLEVIVPAAAEGAGDCITIGASRPAYYGYVFGKALLAPGERVFEQGEGRVTFQGKSNNNPNLFDGPWNDSPVEGYLPNSPFFAMGYTQAEYDAIEATVGVGYVDLPAGS